MSARQCTAPVAGHQPGSASEALCPVHRDPLPRARERTIWPTLSMEPNERQWRETVNAAANVDSAEWLRGLVTHQDATLRESLAKNPSAPDDVLDVLSMDDDAWVRKTVAERKDLPAHIAERLARDVSGEIRNQAALRQDLLPETLEMLAHDDHAGVRSAVVSRNDTPLSVLAGMVDDESPSVGEYARRMVDPVICERFGISKDNASAIEYLRSIAGWWEMPIDGDDVAVALSLSPDPGAST